MKQRSIGQRLFILVVSIFLLFAAAFAMFQAEREDTYKIELLHLRLQDYNRTMEEDLPDLSPEACANYVNRHKMPNLRVTLIRSNGQVFYDNVQANVDSMESHATRKEFAQALKNGAGYDRDRLSQTLHQPYFYSATHFPQKDLVIRTALPYDSQLISTLATNTTYLWFAAALALFLCFVLFRFTSHLGRNILNLRTFANKAEAGEKMGIEELADFPNDELGEIAERIIKLYMRLEETRQGQDRLKRELTQNIAHELKTPTTSIKGYLEAILDYPQMDSATRQQFLQRCYSQARRLSALLQDISTLNRLDSKEQALECAERVDINALLEGIQAETQLQFAAKEMHLHLNLPPHTCVKGNPHLLYSVFRNLTDNALAYTGIGSTVTLTAERQGSLYHFRFSDNGPGVDPRHLPRLFERFYRVDKGRSRELGGTGLGLAIVKNAVLLHGGTLSVQNLPTGGLSFHFTLPAPEGD